MTLSVRIGLRVEQELAQYCAKKGITKSKAVNQALAVLLGSERGKANALERARSFAGVDDRPGDVARHSKKLLRNYARDKSKRA